jgi:pyruvate/2-oxoglutarate dehydrogenase complex dihydrolipoamide dehydrogenase (E3) component
MTGRMMLVQAASHQARVAVENAILGADRADENRLVPHGGFTDPEYGGVGLTEAQARERSAVVVAVVPYADMDRAVIDGRPVGFCKLIVDRETRLILGAHVVGEQAVEIVNMAAAAMAGNTPIEQLAELEFAYPTFAAILGLAARQLARELEAIVLRPEWRALAQLRMAEWERRSGR